MFYGSIIFRFFGVLLRWTVLNIWLVFSGTEKRLKFKEVWDGKQGLDFFSNSSYEFSNILIGAFFVLAVCALLFFLKV